MAVLTTGGYIKEGWGYAAGDRYVAFDQWAFGANAHVRYLSIGDVAPKGRQLAALLSEIKGNGKINIVGHSMGGKEVEAYLATMQSNEAVNNWFATWGQKRRGVNPEIDTRIASVVLNDAWGLNREDNPDAYTGQYLGTWLRSKNISIIDVDSQNDAVNHGKFRDIDYVGDPDYSEDIYGQKRTRDFPPSTLPSNVLDAASAGAWHTYTNYHISRQTRNFLSRYWEP